MQIINEINLLNDIIRDYKLQKKIIGVVPTMGALHDGHMRLVQSAKKECDVVICTLYVNPTQFHNADDLDKYPRTIETDIAILEENACDVLFCPDDKMMYKGNSKLNMHFGELENVLEGQFRPGHFSGVGLVVGKLFNIVPADIAYFGQKDLQQFAIISTLVENLHFNIELRCMPIVRDAQGLALSSRNMRLSEKGKKDALVLYNTLANAKERLLANEAVETVVEKAREEIASSEMKLEYFEVVNKATFHTILTVAAKEDVAICAAGYIEGVRLIDNMLLI